MSHLALPERLFDEPDEFIAWARAALAAAHRVAAEEAGAETAQSAKATQTLVSNQT